MTQVLKIDGSSAEPEPIYCSACRKDADRVVKLGIGIRICRPCAVKALAVFDGSPLPETEEDLDLRYR